MVVSLENNYDIVSWICCNLYVAQEHSRSCFPRRGVSRLSLLMRVYHVETNV